jgi:hypothetical protein
MLQGVSPLHLRENLHVLVPPMPVPPPPAHAGTGNERTGSMEAVIRRGEPLPPPPDRIGIWRYGRTPGRIHGNNEVWDLSIPEAEELVTELVQALDRYRRGMSS